MNNELSIGNHKKLPHYSVIGTGTEFYVWIETSDNNRGSASKWVVGREAFQYMLKLKKLYKKDKNSFIELVKLIHLEHNKGLNI